LNKKGVKKMNSLKRHIHYMNEVAKYETILKPYLSQFFKTFEGKKVLTADNRLIAKIKLDYPEYKPEPFENEKTEVHYITTREQRGVLACKVSLIFWGEGYTHYEEDYLRLYHLENNILTTPIDDEIVFINPEEEIQKIRQYKKLSEEAHNIKRTIKVPESIYKYIQF